MQKLLVELEAVVIPKVQAAQAALVAQEALVVREVQAVPVTPVILETQHRRNQRRNLVLWRSVMLRPENSGSRRLRLIFLPIWVVIRFMKPYIRVLKGVTIFISVIP